MTDAKTPKALILIVILALAGALSVAGCGGGGSSSSAATSPAVEEEAEKGGAEAEEEGTAEGEAGGAEAEGGGEAAAIAEGKTVFTTNCGSCHTLKEAGTSGEVGPDLDELEPDMATVEGQVENGGGGMPAFKSTLSGGEIKAVATYVSSVAGTE